MDGPNLNIIVCNYFGKVMKGGVTIAKEHLKTKKGNVVACTKTKKNGREEVQKLYKEKTSSCFINPRYSSVNDNHEREDKFKFLLLVMIKGEIAKEEKFQWICFV